MSIYFCQETDECFTPYVRKYLKDIGTEAVQLASNLWLVLVVSAVGRGRRGSLTAVRIEEGGRKKGGRNGRNGGRKGGRE